MAFNQDDLSKINSCIFEVQKLKDYIQGSCESILKDSNSLAGEQGAGYGAVLLHSKVYALIHEIDIRSVGAVGQGCKERDELYYEGIESKCDEVLAICTKNLSDDERFSKGGVKEHARIIAFAQFIKSNYQLFHKVHPVVSLMKTHKDQVAPCVGEDDFVLLSSAIADKMMSIHSNASYVIASIVTAIYTEDQKRRLHNNSMAKSSILFDEVSRQIENLQSKLSLSDESASKRRSSWFSKLLYKSKEKGVFARIDKKMAKVEGWDQLKGEFEAIIESKEKELNDREASLTAHDNARSGLVNLIKNGWEEYCHMHIHDSQKSYKARINRLLAQYHQASVRERGEGFKKIFSHEALLKQLNIFWSGCITYASDGRMKEPLQKFRLATPRKKEGVLREIRYGIANRTYMNRLMNYTFNFSLMLLAFTVLVTAAYFVLPLMVKVSSALLTNIFLADLILGGLLVLTAVTYFIFWNFDKGYCRNSAQEFSHIFMHGFSKRVVKGEEIDCARAPSLSAPNANRQEEGIEVNTAAVRGRYD